MDGVDLPLENGELPAAIWLPIVASMNVRPVANFTGRDSNLETMMGMAHSNLPYFISCALHKKMGVSAPKVPITGSARYWCHPDMRFFENRPNACLSLASC